MGHALCDHGFAHHPGGHDVTSSSLQLDAVRLPRGTLGPLTAEFDPGVHLIVGPNGIGKTSLLNGIAGSLPLVSGRLRYAGMALDQRAGQVVLAPNIPPEIPWIRSGMLLDFIVSLYPRSRRDATYRARLLEALGIGAFLDAPLGTLSAGTARKLLLAAALLAAPPVMLFDEPTNDIDAASGAAFIEFVAQIAGRHVVLITTHHTADLAALRPSILELAG
jgi:ABC-type multidrug transport system ATPase subunit